MLMCEVTAVTLGVCLLMHIYQGASLVWHWIAGVPATATSGRLDIEKGLPQ